MPTGLAKNSCRTVPRSRATHFGQLALVYIPYGFYRTGDISLLIEQGGCHTPQKCSLSSICLPAHKFRQQWRHQLLKQSHSIRIFFASLRKHKVNQHRSPVSVKRQGILKIALANHFTLRNSGHFFYGAIPGDDNSFAVDGERRIREEINDICQPLFGSVQSLCRPFALGDILIYP